MPQPAPARSPREPSLLGYSMGGMVFTHFAATAPERVQSAISIGPVHPSAAVAGVFKVREEGMDAISNCIPTAATSSITTPLAKASIREMLLAQSVEGYVLNCKALEEAVPPKYADVKVPVLIIAGVEDKSAPVEEWQYILKELSVRIRRSRSSRGWGIGIVKRLRRGWGSSSGRSAIGLWYERGGYSCISVKRQRARDRQTDQGKR